MLVVLLGASFSDLAQAGELGANKFDLLLQYLPPSRPVPEGRDGYWSVRRAMAKKAIADARDAGFSFLRVSVTGYWPVNFGDTTNDLALWQNDPAAFWAAQDEMFDDLDRASIKLVPTFVWNHTQFPVLGGETMSTFMRDPQSRSQQILARFIRDFVARYMDRRTILFYELTNELNLSADLDLRQKCRPGASSCVLDGFTTADLIAFSENLVPLIRSLDPVRRISSGYSIPRRSASHLMQRPEFAPAGADWSLDSPDEFRGYLLAVHQPFDIISVHVYPSAQETRFARPQGEEYELVADAAEVAKIAGKPLFVGEFGDSFRVTPFMTHLLDELVGHHVDYAAIWVWEYYQNATYRTHDTEPSLSSVEPGYSDDLIAELRETQQALGGIPPRAAEGDPPRVVLTWPLPCSQVKGPVELAAVASDGARGVKSVEFLVDGVHVASGSLPPYVGYFDPGGRGPGVVNIEARAVSVSGSVATSKRAIRLNGAEAACAVFGP